MTGVGKYEVILKRRFSFFFFYCRLYEQIPLSNRADEARLVSSLIRLVSFLSGERGSFSLP